MEATVKRFREQLEKLRVYEHAMGVMYYDMETVMPSGAAALAGVSIALDLAFGYESCAFLRRR